MFYYYFIFQQDIEGKRLGYLSDLTFLTTNTF